MRNRKRHRHDFAAILRQERGKEREREREGGVENRGVKNMHLIRRVRARVTCIRAFRVPFFLILSISVHFHLNERCKFSPIKFP